MTVEKTGILTDADELDRLMAERDRGRLEQLVAEALSAYPPEQAESLRKRLPPTAELRRFEHGGDFVSVLMDGQWLPLDRALELLAE